MVVICGLKLPNQYIFKNNHKPAHHKHLCHSHIAQTTQRPWPACANARGTAMRERHHVYVIELDQDVLYEPKFKKANPNYITGKPCVYVGMTGHDPDTRFDQHKAGIKSNKYAMKYGIRLMPEIYEKLNPMPYGDAQYMEVDLAIRLQQLGYGVWQN